MSSKGRANRRTYSGYFILRLKSFHAKVLVARQLMQNIGRRGDGVRAVEQRASRQLRRGDKPDRRGFVAGNLPVLAGSDLRLLDCIVRREDFGCIREVVAG